MAGAAGATAAAFGEKPVDAAYFSRLQQGLTDSALGVVLAAIGLDEIQKRHGVQSYKANEDVTLRV
jgi:hypothetical protein